MESLPKPVRTKADFVRRYRVGEFGNRSPTWKSVREFLRTVEQWDHDEDQLFHLRNRVPGGLTFYDLSLVDDMKVFEAFEGDPNFYVSAMAPTELTLIQGELRLSVNGWEFYHSTVAKPMRDALAEGGDTLTGLYARFAIAAAMNQPSWDWLAYLLDAYPDHIIEFSVYGKCWGTVPGHNTVFWEVRQY